MAIPASLKVDLAAYITSVKAAAPLQNATRITLASLEVRGAALIAEIGTALNASSGDLDAGDPTGFPGTFADALLALADDSEDQATLATMRGLVGRAVFNLQQAQS